MPIEEWNYNKKQPIGRYAVVVAAVVFSFPIFLMTLWTFITITLGINFGDQTSISPEEGGLLMRVVYLFNLCCMGLFYYLVVHFARGKNWAYKQWMLLSVSLIPFLYYLFMQG